MVIKPLEGDSTPGTVKPFQVSLVEPVAYQFQLIRFHPMLEPKCGRNNTVIRNHMPEWCAVADLERRRCESLSRETAPTLSSRVVLTLWQSQQRSCILRPATSPTQKH